MAWSNSKIFRAFVADVMTRATTYDVDTDSILVALYNNTGTPDQNVTTANSAYNVDQWVTANEVFQAGQWAQGGVALASISVNTATAATVKYTAANTASGSAATLASVYGCLVYDNTTGTKGGFCYNYFGGTQSVTNGTFTIVWNASNGIFAFAL